MRAHDLDGHIALKPVHLLARVDDCKRPLTDFRSDLVYICEVQRYAQMKEHVGPTHDVQRREQGT